MTLPTLSGLGRLKRMSTWSISAMISAMSAEALRRGANSGRD